MLIIVFIVISSPAVTLVNSPQHALANPRVTDTSTSHATLPQSQDPSPPSMSSLGTPTAQAPLQIPRTLQSTDLVNSLAFYEVTFITSTTGAIDKIRMDFPAGTGVGAAGIIERVGIGGGTLLKSGSSITYDLTTPVSIPAGTFIRLEMFGIKNPINPSTTFTADITTRDSGGNLIDGPSQTNVYTIKKIGSADIADGAITASKISPAYAISRFLQDDTTGHSFGWNPDGVNTVQNIFDPLATANSVITININDFGFGVCHALGVIPSFPVQISIKCTVAPPEGSTLKYTLTNLPFSL